MNIAQKVLSAIAENNRIGVDTGAYISGRLTALVLEGTKRRYLEAVDENGAITAAARQLAA